MRFTRLLPLLGTAQTSQAATACWRNTTCNGPTTAAFQGPWDSYIYAPSSRDVEPAAVLSDDLLSSTPYNGSVSLYGNSSQAVIDFGIEVGGITSLSYASTGSGELGLAWSESKTYVGRVSDSSNGASAPEGYLSVNFTDGEAGSYEVPLERLRGGFRYLTLFLLTDDSSIEITNISVEISFQPTWADLQAYQGYFYSSDDTLNKIWYSGAYTVQTNSVPVDTGRRVPFVDAGWANDGILGNGSTIIVDGAKRDRAVWPGDMGVAVPAAFYSIGEIESVKNALQVMYDHQNSDGSLPEAGPPLLQQNSDSEYPRPPMPTLHGLTHRSIPHVDDDRDLDIRPVQQRHGVRSGQLGQVHGRHGVHLRQGSGPRPAERDRNSRLGTLAAGME